MTLTKIVRLGRKGQMVLPKEVREALKLEEGDSVLIVLHDGQAVLTTPERYAALTRGMLRGTWGQTPEELERYLRRERATWDKAKA